MKKKHCKVCHSDKEQEQFYKQSMSKDGLSNQCRECQKASSKKTYRDNIVLLNKLKKQLEQNG